MGSRGTVMHYENPEKFIQGRDTFSDFQITFRKKVKII